VSSLQSAPAIACALGLAFNGLAFVSPARGQSDWQDPAEFSRLVEGACLDGASIAEKADRIAMIEQTFGLVTATESGPDAPDLVTPEGVSAAWNPQYEPDLFCVLTAPAGFYAESGVAAITDRLDGSTGTPAPEPEPWVFAPILRGLDDGRTIQFAVFAQPGDELLLVGMIQD
jgi:hypothetical protein